MIDVKAKGSGYYRVFADDGTGPVQLSQHTTEREAESRAINEAIRLAFETPGSRVYYSHDYEVDVTINTATATMIVTGGGVITPGDQIADPIAGLFVDQTNVTISTTRPSNQITILGIDVPTSISVNFGEYQINGGAWVSAPGTVEVDDLVAVRHQSSGQNATPTNQILTIGGVIQDTFTLTTGTINAILWNEPAFLGFTAAQASLITMNTLYTNVDSGVAPLAVYVDASNVAATGTNLLSGAPSIEPYMHLDHRITATLLGGGAIPSADETTDPNTRLAVNAYTDQIGPNAAFIFHNPGTYRITLTSTDFFGTTNSVSKDIIVSEPDYANKFYDGIAGLDTNDGNDALGLSLSNASFVHSTRELTHAGLSAYDHVAATTEAYLTDNYNWIWLEWNGAANSGWFRIESQNGTTITLATSLGANFSDVSSSNGPKQTFNPATEIVNNTAYHFKINQTYDITSEINIENTSVRFHSWGGNGQFTIRTISGMSALVWCSNNSSFIGNIHTHNMIYDGNGFSHYPIRLSSDAAAVKHTLVLDRCKIFNTASDRIIYWGGGLYTTSVDQFFWNTELDNRQLGSEEKDGGVLGSLKLGSHSVCFGTRSISQVWDPINPPGSGILHHHFYLTGESDHRLRAYTDFPEAPQPNNGLLSFCFNENSGSAGGGESDAFYVSYVNNRFRNAQLAIDASNTSNNRTGSVFQQVVAIRNATDGNDGWGVTRAGESIFVSGLKSAFIGYNLAIDLSASRAFYATFDNNGEADDHIYIEGNVTYNCNLANANTLADYQIINNIAQDNAASTAVLSWDIAGNGPDTHIQDNQFWVPNDTTPYINGGSQENLTALNAHAGNSGNFEQDPGFLDPASNDFRRLATDVKFEVVEFTTLLGSPPATQFVPLTPGFGIPKAIMIIQSADRSNSGAGGSGYNNDSFCVGYSDGVNNICGYVMNDAESSANGVQECKTTMNEYVSLRTQGNHANGAGTRNAMTATFQTDQVTLSYEYLNPAGGGTEAFPCTLIAFGGDDIVNADVGYLDDLDTASSIALGYRPDIFFSFSGGFSALDPIGGVFSNGAWDGHENVTFSHGIAIDDGIPSQMGMAWFSPDGGIAGDQRHTIGLYNDASLASVTTGNTENYDMSVGFTGTGVTLTPSATTGNHLMGYMALEFTANINMAMVDVDIPVSPSDLTVSGVGFTPSLAYGIFINGLVNYSAAEDTNHSMAQVTMDADTIFSIMNNAMNAVGASDTGATSRWNDELNMTVLPTGAGANTALDVESSSHVFNSGGVTFTMTNWPATPVKGRMLFLGIT